MKKLLFFLSLTVVTVTSISIGNPSNASAISGNEFQAGRIMDDAIFFGNGSIDAYGIQAFLNSKVPVCDTYGTNPSSRASYAASRGYSPPFTCLKDYVQDTHVLPGEPGLCNGFSGGRKSAAQIIHEVSISCGVSPKVILVLLQKEQSFITDDWPWAVQYQKATGYACPDNPPASWPSGCDPEFAGFFKQVYYGARQFKRYAQTPNSWGYRSGRVNYIQYNPNASCGGSNVFIQNQATAGLYIYTPYQPNAAALSVVSDSSPGPAVNCGAYGNRNFWWQYNKWFGSTLGALIRTANSPALYYTEGQKRFAVPSMEIANLYNLGISDVRFVSDAEMNSIPMASSPFSNKLSQVAKSERDDDADGASLYIMSNGYRIPISSMTQFTDFGFQTQDIAHLPLSTLQRLPQYPKNLSNYVQAPDRSVYKIENDKMRAIFELPKLAQENPGGNITPLSQFTFTNWSFGTPIVDGDYVIIGPDNGIRTYKNGSYQKVSNMGVYDCLKLGSIKTFRVGLYAVSGGNHTGDLTCFVQKTNNEVYMSSYFYKFRMPSSSGLPISKPSDSLIDRIPTQTLKTVVKGSGNELSIIENNKKRAILNMTAFNQLGLNSSNITALSQEAYRRLAYGPRILPLGQVVGESNGSLSVITSLAGRTSITSMRQFEDYAYKTSSITYINTSEQQAYPSSGSLSPYIKTSDGIYLIDAKVRYKIPQDLEVHYGQNRASMSTYPSYTISNTLPWTATRFIKSTSSDSLYYLENGQKRPISSLQKLEQLGGSNKIIILSKQAVDRIPTGSGI